MNRPPLRWSGRLLAALALVSFTFGIWGFRQHTGGAESPWLDAAYRSLQLFFMNFEHPQPAPVKIGFFLQLARFGAFVTTIWAILLALFPQVSKSIRRWLRWRGPSCAVILGYGPVGQAIGTALWQQKYGIKRITAVHSSITPELAARARLDRVLLIEGDPSDPRILDHIFARRAERIYVSDPDDLRAIDSAVAVSQQVRDPAKDIRVVLKDSAVAGKMAEATSGGYMGMPGLSWFSLADETARLLVADRRFDRVAVENGQDRLHLVIIGCGSQGEAIAVETLLTGWRKSLGPPRITFLDKDATLIKARMRRRMPAWFLQPNGAALPEAARPIFDFRTFDAETIDFARDADFDDLRKGATAWVLATGDGALNLRASLSLHQAIGMRQIAPAPIYVRVPSGHDDEAPDLVGQHLAMVHPFGAIKTVIAGSPLLDIDPDDLPRKLHNAYARASVDMGLASELEDWENLPESKRNANRALFRHAAMKLEDFGAEAQPVLRKLPQVDLAVQRRLARVDDALDYAKIDCGSAPEGWFRSSQAREPVDLQTALDLRASALCEHNRWTNERALEQFVPAPTSDGGMRDDVRRLHNNMFDWYDLETAAVRRFDVVLLRALLSEATEDPSAATAKPHRAKVLFLPILADGMVGELHVSNLGVPETADATEWQLHLCAASEPKNVSALVPLLMDRLAPCLNTERQIPPRRIRFDFLQRPSSRILALANQLATKIQSEHNARLVIEPRWFWPADARTTIGFVGHRDLAGFGDEQAILDRLSQTFMRLAAQGKAGGLVCGYTHGADQLAVRAWNALGLPLAQLVFPYDSAAADATRQYHTDDPSKESSGKVFSELDLQHVGTPQLPEGDAGHTSQAKTVLKCADTLIALLDEKREVLPGGTLDTVTKFRAQRRDVTILGPEPQ